MREVEGEEGGKGEGGSYERRKEKQQALSFTHINFPAAPPPFLPPSLSLSLFLSPAPQVIVRSDVRNNGDVALVALRAHRFDVAHKLREHAGSNQLVQAVLQLK